MTFGKQIDHRKNGFLAYRVGPLIVTDLIVKIGISSPIVKCPRKGREYQGSSKLTEKVKRKTETQRPYRSSDFTLAPCQKGSYCIFTIWPYLNTRSPVPGVMKFTILVDLSMVTITIHLVCMNTALE